MEPGNPLLLDIGNSRLKALPLAAFASDRWQASLSQSELDGKPFQQVLDEVLGRLLDDARSRGAATPALWATGGRRDPEVERWCRSRHWQLHLVRAGESPAPIRLSTSYHRPESLGSDRWLAMIAALQLASPPLVVADAGTALTLDVVLGEGGINSHDGGVILPGLQLARQSLEPCVGELAPDGARRDSPPSVGRSTAEGIEKGALLAAGSAIAALLAELKQQQGCCSLLLTGGDGERLAQAAMLQAWQPRFEPQLTLRGLAAVARAAGRRL